MGSSSKQSLYERARAFYQNPSAVALTRHEALVLTNEPPEDADKPYILSVIAKADAELEEIDALLSKMTANADVDSERRKKTEDYRASLLKWRSFNQAIFSPVRRIPPEILSEIFSHLAPPTKDMGFFVLMEQWDIGVTWFLSLVCRRWRAVALSMPSLWSLVVISATMPLSLVECQMKRSRKLQIYFLEDSKRNFETRVDAFELLCRYSHLWEDLSIFGTTPDMLRLLESIRDRVSSLRRLWIHWGPRHTNRK
ncbi:hypothetical protein R3P38DRAFT_3212521 [Favolaschia claudopus]|uniref:F-box domain-containing protein n=1 Tax=Favolaschia claudopus TaxID=2862362 RepID=A0AAW0ADX8_9AGAR